MPSGTHPSKKWLRIPNSSGNFQIFNWFFTLSSLLKYLIYLLLLFLQAKKWDKFWPVLRAKFKIVLQLLKFDYNNVFTDAKNVVSIQLAKTSI